MKKLVLIIVCLVGIAVALSCKKEKPEDPLSIWNINIRLVDSIGNAIFQGLPPNIQTTPFDPSGAFWIDGTGKRRDIWLSGVVQYGMFFTMGVSENELKEDTNYLNRNFFVWKVFLHPDSPSYLLEVYQPDVIQGFPAETVLWNGDTVCYNKCTGSSFANITYP